MTAEEGKGSGAGCLWAVGVVVFLIILVKCSATDKPAQPFASPSLQNQMEAIQAPPTIDPFDPTSVVRASAHLKAVMGAQGLSGAMIYSQNCYDALSRDFSWKKLDECGGFDMLAVRVAANFDVTDLSSEADYFGSEAAAGRYLAAATKAGEDPSKADLRLEAVKAKASRSTVPKPKPTPVQEEVLPTDDVTPANDVEVEGEDA